MKNCLVLVWAWLAAGSVFAAGERAFVLATAGAVDAAFAEKVMAGMERECAADVRMAPPLAVTPGQSLEAIGLAGLAALGPDDHSLVVLVRPDTEQPQGVCRPDRRFAVLNIARLEPGTDEARLERRTIQEGLRVLAMLLGMAPCPFPLCVLTGYEKTEDLDEMSGNYCPPCRERFHRISQEAGLRLLPDPIYNPPPEEPAAPAAEESAPEVPVAAEAPAVADSVPAAEASALAP